MKSIIYSFSPGSFYKDEMVNTYSILKNIVKHSIVSTKCKCKSRVCLGPFTFLTHKDLAIKPHTYLHIIISGKDIEEFNKHFKNELIKYDYLTLLGELSANSSAFNIFNDKLIKRLSWEKVSYQSKSKKQFKIIEI